jgi:hypothetical protein
VGLYGLRIHDGHGRGVQQQEKRWQEVELDPLAEVVVPAGNWAVSVCVGAGDTTGVYELNAHVELSLLKFVPADPPDVLFSGYHEVDSFSGSITLPNYSRDCTTFVQRFEFEPGWVYKVEARIDELLSHTDTLANDNLVAKVRVLDCFEDDKPNGLDEDGFCRAGIPFPDVDFGCWDERGTCRECWFGLFPHQCEDGQFCVDGMCDDVFTCWSGTLEDEWEGFPESSPMYWGDFATVFGRTLHKEAPNGDVVQDNDHVRFSGIGQDPHGSFLKLHAKVTNHCWDPPPGPIPEIMEELEIRLAQWGTINTPFGWIEGWKTIVDWTHPHRTDGLETVLSPAQVEGYLSDKPLLVSLRNDAVDPESFSYTMDVGLEYYAPEIDWDPWELEPDDSATPVGPWGTIDMNFEEGRIPEIRPIPSSVEQGYIVFFRPDDPFGTLTQTTSMIMLDRLGRVASAADRVVGYAEELDDGLAIRMAGLDLGDGPFTVHMQNDSERVVGGV